MFQVQKYEPGTKIARSGVYSGVPMALYHSGKLCDGPSISSSGLRTIFSKSELDYYVRSPYNPARLESDEPAYFKLGRAAHHLFLGEKGFGDEFIVRPEVAPDGKDWNGNNKSCKAWLAEQELKGLTVLKPADITCIQGMAGLLPWQRGLHDSGLLNCAPIMENGLLHGLTEHTIVWQEPKTKVYLLARPDVIPVDSLIGADIKTTDEIDDLALERTYSAYRYDMQAALARMCLRGATGLDLTHFAFVFISKKEPHEARLKETRQEELAEAEGDIVAATQAFKKCLDTKRWPGKGSNESDASYVGLTKWATEGAEWRRKQLARAYAQ